MFLVRTYILFFVSSFFFFTCTNHSDWPEKETSILSNLSPDKSKKIELLTKKEKGLYLILVTEQLSDEVKINDEVFAKLGYHKHNIKTYWNTQSDTVFIEIDYDFGDNNILKVIPVDFR